MLRLSSVMLLALETIFHTLAGSWHCQFESLAMRMLASVVMVLPAAYGVRNWILARAAPEVEEFSARAGIEPAAQQS